MKFQATLEKIPPNVPKKRVFVPSDFEDVLQNVSHECPLVGGQAVAWWAKEFCPSDPSITSSGIDFWGFRDDLQKLARALGQKPIFPHEYEMTIWVGGIALQIKGEKTTVKFINTVPGLDSFIPEKVSVRQKFSSGKQSTNLLVLSPVSLVLAKLYALRAFNQKDRQDELHLKVSLVTSRQFIEQLLHDGQIKQTLWNVERLIAAGQNKPYQNLELQYGFDIQTAIPIDRLQEFAGSPAATEEDHIRIRNFCEIRWPRIRRKPPSKTSSGGECPG